MLVFRERNTAESRPERNPHARHINAVEFHTRVFHCLERRYDPELRTAIHATYRPRIHVIARVEGADFRRQLGTKH